MCSYNLLNGKPMCANEEMLGGRLRGSWGFDGHVVSDCSAVENIFNLQHGASAMDQAAAMALNAGTDLNCGQAYHALNASIAAGLTNVETLDRAVARTLQTRFEVGQLNAWGSGPYDHVNMSAVGSAAHMDLAERAALESMVLLKNQGGTELPLPAGGKLRRLAVIGPHANDSMVMLGNYHGLPAFGFDHVVTPLQALQARLGKSRVAYAPGCAITGDGAWGFGDAVAWRQEARERRACLNGCSSGFDLCTRHACGECTGHLFASQLQ